jgi:hypothetical protein
LNGKGEEKNSWTVLGFPEKEEPHGKKPLTSHFSL